MKRHITGERKEFVKALSLVMDVKSIYNGPPTFSYTVGGFMILKDGTVEFEPTIENLEILKKMETKVEMEESKIEAKEEVTCTLSFEGLVPKTVINTLKLLYNYQLLLNRSMGIKEGITVDKGFVDPLDGIESIDDIGEKAAELNKYLSGIVIRKNGIELSVLSRILSPDKRSAYLDLISRISVIAGQQNRVTLDIKNPENEKYAFRCWLLRLGMSGERYKDARRILLENLSGNCAFKTAEQMDEFKIKHRKN